MHYEWISKPEGRIRPRKAVLVTRKMESRQEMQVGQVSPWHRHAAFIFTRIGLGSGQRYSSVFAFVLFEFFGFLPVRGDGF
jgi:hypothetical protein